MFILSPDQQKAVDDVLLFLQDDDPASTEMSVSGPAGTGKTVLTSYIIDAAYKQNKMITLLDGEAVTRPLHLTSTTNKAARVLAEATGRQAGTIHSLLGLRPIDDYKTGKSWLQKTANSRVIENAFIIIDEGSMANEDLLRTIRESTLNCKVLYIGDSYQLAPVFENSCPVFRDVKLQTKLTTIQRQAAGSPIIQFASGFRQALDTGDFPEIMENYNNVVRLVDGPEFKRLAIQEFTDMKDLHHARLVAWTNKRVHQYNDFLRKLNTPNDDYEIGELLLTNKPILEPNKHVLYSADSLVRITQSEPDERHGIEGVYLTLDRGITVFQANDQEEVTNLTKHYQKHGKRTGDWVDYFDVKGIFSDLRPIYSCTVNKAQGSTYKNVFIDLDDIGRNTKPTEIARLMYTAITRASDKVYMYGSLPRRLYA